MEKEKPEKSAWDKVNKVILILGFFTYPLMFMLLLSVIGLTMPLLVVQAFIFLLIPHYYGKFRKTGKCRKALRNARIAYILLTVFMFSLPFIGSGFDRNKLLYIPKKFVYTHGVHGLGSEISSLLPDHLPKECRSYKYRTMLGVVAQDYHAASYLSFYTDSETLSEYEEYVSSVENCKKMDTAEKKGPIEYKGNYYSFPKNLCPNGLGWLDKDMLDVLGSSDELVIYEISGSYHWKGCCFDRTSGLVYFWT